MSEPGFVPLEFERKDPDEVVAAARAFRAALEAIVEPTDGLFEFGARLSGAGIVTQTLKGPESERPFFGLVGEDGFRIARIVDSTQVTPFEPIIDGEFVPHSGQVALRIKLRPHPNAGLAGDVLGVGSAILFGLVLIAAGLGWWNDDVESARALTLVIGFGGLAFLGRRIPARRAQLGFAEAVERAVGALVAALDLSRLSE